MSSATKWAAGVMAALLVIYGAWIGSTVAGLSTQVALLAQAVETLTVGQQELRAEIKALRLQTHQYVTYKAMADRVGPNEKRLESVEARLRVVEVKCHSIKGGG